jgi:hypothetical protein
MNTNFLCDIMPIIDKAAPVLSRYIGGPLTQIVLGLLGLLADCDPDDHQALALKLQQDPDLFAKLSKLESTHKEWLMNMIEE